jgi:hypothetical protein
MMVRFELIRRPDSFVDPYRSICFWSSFIRSDLQSGLGYHCYWHSPRANRSSDPSFVCVGDSSARSTRFIVGECRHRHCDPLTFILAQRRSDRSGDVEHVGYTSLCTPHSYVRPLPLALYAHICAVVHAYMVGSTLTHGDRRPLRLPVSSSSSTRSRRTSRPPSRYSLVQFVLSMRSEPHVLSSFE